MMSNAPVCTVTLPGGGRYVVKRISADPIKYVAFSDYPTQECLHRDGKDLHECMELLGRMIAPADRASVDLLRMMGVSRAEA